MSTTPQAGSTRVDGSLDDATLEPGFSEKAFYLEEFRSRTLALMLQDAAQAQDPALLSVLAELGENRTRVLVVAPAGARVDGLDCPVVGADEPGFEGRLWRVLRERGRAEIETGPAEDPFETLLRVASRLHLFKVVLLDEGGGYHDARGRRRAFVDLEELERLLESCSDVEEEVLRRVERLLAAGVPNVNWCTAEGLHDELFTYSGSGTLFTRYGHISVRLLGIDDYDSADDLISRGVAEGFLAPRDEAEIDRLLPRAFGAFVENHHLAGLAGLKIDAEESCGEIVSLYAVTRFLGEGVGVELVKFALAWGRRLGLEYLFACTTSKRAGAFFERIGFAPISQREVPERKWEGYDPERRARVCCFRHDL